MSDMAALNDLPESERNTVEDALMIRDLLLDIAEGLPSWITKGGVDPRFVMEVTQTAQVILWRNEMRHAAFGGVRDVFSGGVSDIAGTQPQLWVLEFKLEQPDDQCDLLGWPRGSSLVGMLLVGKKHPRPCVSCIYLGEDPDGSTARFYGTRIPEDEPLTPGDCYIAGMLKFLDQKFVSVEPQKAPLRERRLARHGLRRALPGISVVTLRRTTPGESCEGAEDTEHRDWSCRWLVGSHWRKPNARMKEQRPVFVRPYVKGPDDKPLRPPKGTVYDVRR